MSTGLVMLLLSAWVLWHGMGAPETRWWRAVRTYEEPHAREISAEQACELMRQALTGAGTFVCQPAGTVPGPTTRHQRLKRQP
jgi:hypothetical protein